MLHAKPSSVWLGVLVGADLVVVDPRNDVTFQCCFQINIHRYSAALEIDKCTKQPTNSPTATGREQISRENRPLLSDSAIEEFLVIERFSRVLEYRYAHGRSTERRPWTVSGRLFGDRKRASSVERMDGANRREKETDERYGKR